VAVLESEVLEIDRARLADPSPEQAEQHDHRVRGATGAARRMVTKGGSRPRSACYMMLQPVAASLTNSGTKTG
jgi:hypothetical protein